MFLQEWNCKEKGNKEGKWWEGRKYCYFLELSIWNSCSPYINKNFKQGLFIRKANTEICTRKQKDREKRFKQREVRAGSGGSEEPGTPARSCACMSWVQTRVIWTRSGLKAEPCNWDWHVKWDARNASGRVATL